MSAAATAWVPRQRGGLRAVQAGPVAQRGPGHPLALGRQMRARLRRAVHELLATAGLEDAPDTVRLAVLVLASRMPKSLDGTVIRTGELGRWLGLETAQN